MKSIIIHNKMIHKIKLALAYFDLKMGWFFTNPRKLEKMEDIYMETYLNEKKKGYK